MVIEKPTIVEKPMMLLELLKLGHGINQHNFNLSQHGLKNYELH